MVHKRLWIMTLLVVASLLLAACPAAAPAPTENAAEAPAATLKQPQLQHPLPKLLLLKPPLARQWIGKVLTQQGRRSASGTNTAAHAKKHSR